MPSHGRLRSCGKEKLGETTFKIKIMRASAALKAMVRQWCGCLRRLGVGAMPGYVCMEHRRVEEWNLGTLPQLRKAQEVVARDSAGGTRLALAFSGVCTGRAAGLTQDRRWWYRKDPKGTRREREGSSKGTRLQGNESNKMVLFEGVFQHVFLEFTSAVNSVAR
jgi:hypothetical protein